MPQDQDFPSPPARTLTRRGLTLGLAPAAGAAALFAPGAAGAAASPGTGSQWCDSYAELRSLVGGSGAESRNVAVVRGSPAGRPFPAGGGLFVWVPGTVARDDGATVVTPPAPYAGYWRRQFSGPLDVAWFGARGDNAADDTAAIQAALNEAQRSGASSVFVPDGVYAVRGTLTIPSGVTLFGNPVAGEYWDNFYQTEHGQGGNAGQSRGAQLRKGFAGDPLPGKPGPLAIMLSSSGLRGLALRHYLVGGATTGVIQMGRAGEPLHYACVADCSVMAKPTGDTAASGRARTTSYGVFFTGGAFSTAQRYFNRFSNLVINECDVAVHLGFEASANLFNAILTRQCHVHYDLDGGPSKACVDNVFTGLQLQSIGALEPASVCFRLRNGCLWNAFTGFSTETSGTTFEIDASCEFNRFDGVSNELAGSRGAVIPSTSPRNLAGTNQTGAIYQGAGAPPDARGRSGDVYFRTDAPGTGGQRIYIKNGTRWIGIA